MIFKGLSVTENCARSESAPLRHKELTLHSQYYQAVPYLS